MRPSSNLENILGSIADLILLRILWAICQKSWELSFLEVMDSLGLLAHASMAALRNVLQHLEYFRFRRLILLVETKKLMSKNYGSSSSSLKP